MNEQDATFLKMAGRLALRGHGRVEPNPLVGCVIVSRSGAIVGWGHHAFFGGAHAEVNALRRAGAAARDATAYLTLEPCSHTGKTPPCTDALIDAQIGRVVLARRDPNPEACGGLERLLSAGIEVVLAPEAGLARAAGAPFAHRIETGLPWITAKWAQTIDGRVATRHGESQWISSPSSRRLVHRERGRVCAIVTGVGTVRADDPLLTAREVRQRRVARRVVVDPRLETPPSARLVRTARQVPTTIIAREIEDAGQQTRRVALETAGVSVRTFAPDASGAIDLARALCWLVEQHQIAHVLVEAGPGLLGRLLARKLVNEAWVFIAPLLVGDDEAIPCLRGREIGDLREGTALQTLGCHRRSHDVLVHYRFPPAAPPATARRTPP